MDLSDTTIKPMPCLIPAKTTLYCNCGSQISQELDCTINAPSSQWGETIELWKCHDEDFSYMLEDVKGKLKIADKRAVLDFTTLTINDKTIVKEAVLVGEKGEITCEKCNLMLGDIKFNDQYSIYIDKCLMFKNSKGSLISEPVQFEFYRSFINTVRSVYDENYTKELLISSIESDKEIFIKILSMDSFVAFGKTSENIPKIPIKLDVCIKLLYGNDSEGIQLAKLKQCQVYKCTENEIMRIAEILDSANRQLPEEMRSFKKLFNVCFLIYNP